jgi:hypothetical protein
VISRLNPVRFPGMSAQLVAPRPLRLSAAVHVPFFLSNSLSAPSPVSPPAFVGPAGLGHGALLLDAGSMENQPPIVSQSIPQITNNPNGADQDLAIEDMAARICLDDEADTVSANTTAPASAEAEKNGISTSSTTVAEEIAKTAPRCVRLFLISVK